MSNSEPEAVAKPAAAREAEERTRDRVLGAVLEHGPVSAAELGERLGFTPAAVRRHLDALSTQGLIEVKRVSNPSSGAGRPARRYVLSAQGQAYLGNDYLDIATEALRQLGLAADGQQPLGALQADGRNHLALFIHQHGMVLHRLLAVQTDDRAARGLLLALVALGFGQLGHGVRS